MAELLAVAALSVGPKAQAAFKAECRGKGREPCLEGKVLYLGAGGGDNNC